MTHHPRHDVQREKSPAVIGVSGEEQPVVIDFSSGEPMPLSRGFDRMEFSSFRGLLATTPTRHEGTIHDLVNFIGPHKTIDRKESAAAITAGLYPPGLTRRKGDPDPPEFSKLFIADIDDLNEVGEDDLICKLGDATYILHTTYSHAECMREGKMRRYRLVLLLSRGYSLKEYCRLFDAIDSMLGGLLDKQTRKPKQFFFVATCPPGEEGKQQFVVQLGTPLDVDVLLSRAPDRVTEQRAKRSATPRACGYSPAPDVEAFQDFISAGRLQRKRAKFRDVATRYLRLRDGDATAVPSGQGNAFWLSLTWLLAGKWPSADPAALAALLMPALLDRQSLVGDERSIDALEEMIARAQDKILKKRGIAPPRVFGDASNTTDVTRIQGCDGSMQGDPEPSAHNWIAEASGGKRTKSYTEAELEQFAREANVPMATLLHRLIIHIGASYYVFFDGSYVGPFTQQELWNQCRKYLSAMPSVDLYKETTRGVARRTPADLTEHYGTAARCVVADRTVQRSYYDAAAHCLVEAASPLRALEARRDDRVAHWLQLLAGPMHDKLLDWLATSVQLDKPTCALLLTGKRHTGKTLLANGLARLWSTEGPVPLSSAFKQFNDLILRCPVLLGDEKIPEDFRGKSKTEELRELIQARTYRFERKYHSEAMVRGCFRVIMAANNEQFLHIDAALNEHDVEAIAERILHITVGDAALTYLEELNERDGAEGRQAPHHFFTLDEIAQHVLWLAETRKVVPGSRFLVAGGSAETIRSVAVRSQNVSLVCQVLVGLLLERRNPGELLRASMHKIHVYQGKLVAHAGAVFDAWPLDRPDGQRRPTIAHIETALSTIAPVRTSRTLPPRPGMAPTEMKLRVVKTDYLIEWAEQHGFAAREQIEAALAVDTVFTGGALRRGGQLGDADR